MSSRCTVGRILAHGKDTVSAHGVSKRIHRRGRFGCLRTGMHSHVAEFAPETRFKEGSAGEVERLARAKRVEKIVRRGTRPVGVSLELALHYLIFVGS